jgi:folate-binding protein YgfZ
MWVTSRHTGRVTPFWTECSRDFVQVSGADALTYLQSQISQDIRGLMDGESAYSFVLHPAGKIDALVRIVRLGADNFVIDTDHGFGEGLMARLNRFRIRVKADVVALPWTCIAIRGTHAPEASGIAVAAWGDANCFDVIGADVQPPDASSALRHGSVDDLELARIRAGWPSMGREITDASIPAESGVVDLAVNFTKGCYPGQELVERMDSRGSQAPRFVRQLRSPAIQVFVGDEIIRADTDTVVGHVTSVAQDVDDTSKEVIGWLALGVVARSAQPGDRVSVRGQELSVHLARA